jgi:hypothetical protein
MKTLFASPPHTLRAFLPLFAGAILPMPAARALDITVAPGGNIQSAIDQVNAAGGGTVNLQAGTFTVASSLLLRSNVTLKGAGAGSTTIQNTGGTARYTLLTKPAAAMSNVTRLLKNPPPSRRNHREGAFLNGEWSRRWVSRAAWRRGPRVSAAICSVRAHRGRGGRYAPDGFGGAVSISFAMRIKLQAAATYCAAACVRAMPR